MKFAFLMENKTDRDGLVAEHGLSVYIEAHGRKILFDTGASDLFVKNAEKMKINLEEVEELVISHGHYDHTGGVPAFCKINKIAPVYVHENAFYENFSLNENGERSMDSIPWTEHECAEIDPRIIRTSGVKWLDENIAVSGTVPRIDGYEPTATFYRILEDGSVIEDNMDHEQMLVIREPEGLYVFSGRSHRGVVPAIRYAREIFGGEKIAVLVAGMHLYSADEEMRNKVVGQILEEEIDTVMPVHCTGINAICDLKAALGENRIVATTGTKYGY
jgi:7,8-dihydropterin-6-yl-methyl-4-(beta-D-ribofuranosyl)aminobenzene 5'-phosphate synthase